jgi:tellurite resistance protein
MGKHFPANKEVIMKTSDSAKILARAINLAIEDHIITNSEYEDILHIANEDGIIDPEERALLSQLQDMIADRSVRRVAD